MSSKNVWLETENLEEILSGLEFTLEQLRLTQDNTYRWKWVILGIDNALQNAMVIAATDGTGSTVLKMIKPKKVNKDSQEKLDNFSDLLKTIQNPTAMERNTYSRTTNLSKRTIDKILFLHEIRNKFIHYHPNTTSGMYVPDLRTASKSCTRLIQWLLFKSGNVHLDMDANARAKRSLDAIFGQLSAGKRSKGRQP